LNGFPKGVRRILLGKADSIRVFDFDRERFITQPVQSMTGFLRNQSSVGLRVNERYLFYEFAPRRIRILDLDDGGKTICELALPHELGTTRNIDDAVDGRDVNVGLEILPKVNRILTTGPNGELDFWVLQTGKHVATVHVATAREARSITGYILSPDGSKCVIREGLGNDGTLVAVRPADGKAISRHIEGATYDFEASFSEDGTRFIGPDSSSLWDTRTWSQIAAYPNSRDDNIGAASMALHPQNCVFFCPCTRRLHSMKTGAPVSRPICKAPPRYSCYSDDGRFVAVSTLTELFVFDIHLNRCVGPITLGSTPYIGFTPDSKMVTTRTADRLRLWDPQTGEEVLPATPWDGNEWAVEFSPDGQSFSYSTGNHVSISSLPRDDRTVAQLEHAIDAVSQSSMETMTATKWSTLGRGLNDLNRHITGGRTKPASADAVAEDYSVDEAIRDIGLHEHDIHAFLDVAQTAARADQWTLAEQAIDQAMNAGAKGQGATFLKGFIDLQAGRYRDSEVGLAHALSKKGNRIVAGLLFQASVGARDYSGASLAFEKPYLGESVLASLRNISFAVLAQAAQGEEQVARARLADVIRRGRSGEPEHFDYVSTYMATVSATLDTGVAESPYILKVLGESDETDPFVAQALTLGLARSGQIARAKQRLAKVGAANTDPEYMMARVLVSQGAGVAYRNALDQCISGCQTIIDENDAHTFDGAVKIIRAIVLQREAKRKLAKI